jgi:hypothetical protein
MSPVVGATQAVGVGEFSTAVTCGALVFTNVLNGIERHQTSAQLRELHGDNVDLKALIEDGHEDVVQRFDGTDEKVTHLDGLVTTLIGLREENLTELHTKLNGVTNEAADVKSSVASLNHKMDHMGSEVKCHLANLDGQVCSLRSSVDRLEGMLAALLAAQNISIPAAPTQSD